MKYQELKIFLYLVLAITVLAELFGSTGLTTTPLKELHSVFFSKDSIYLIGGITLHSFLMKLFSPADKREIVFILLAGTIFSILYFLIKGTSGLPYWYLLSIPEAGLGVTSFCVILYKSFSSDEKAEDNRSLLIGSICIYLVALNIDCYLQLTSAVHPIVYDPSALKFDLSLGADFSSDMAVLIGINPLLHKLVSASYTFVPYGFSILFGLYVAAPEKAPANILKVILTSMFFAFSFYHITPAAGPVHAFSYLFPLNMPSAEALKIGAGYILPAPRNAIPSMHIGWTFIMWLISLNYRLVIRLGFGLLLILNVMATLGLGEHYLVDLIVAIPFMLFVFAISRKPLIEDDKRRTHAFITGFVLTILWCVYIRTGHEIFNAIPGMSWLLVLATVFICYRLFTSILFAKPRYREYPLSVGESTFSGVRLTTLLVCLVFFLSGFSALVYQVVFSKILSYTFGSNSSAVYSILATYMGGMAIGAWLGGRIVLLKKPPLAIYALIELAIAVYCVMSPQLFQLVQLFYTHIGSGMQPGSAGLDAVRFLLGVLVLLLPTILMGMSLPVLIAHFKMRKQTYGDSIAVLYAVNTLGAAMGALISGYFIIPTVGIKLTIYIAAWLNIVAAAIAYLFSRKQQYVPSWSEEDGSGHEPATIPPGLNLFRTGSGHVALFVTGFITLGLEIIYVHMLSIVAGNSVYAFSLMLFTFLLGLCCGSELARRIMAGQIRTAWLIGLSTIILSMVIITGVLLWELIPGYFAGFEHYPSGTTFTEREFIRGLVCFICMFPPAVIIGFLYPACLQHVADMTRTVKIKALSSAIALNTAGNILGVLVIGFVVLPRLGPLNSSYLLALLSGLVCIYFLCFNKLRENLITTGIILFCIALYINSPGGFDYNKLASGANVYFKKQYFGDVIDHLESLDGGLTTVHNYRISDRRSIRTLLTNGKFQGTDDINGELIPQYSYALVPLLHTSARNDALVIGYGTGSTSNILHKAGFKSLDVVDISKDIFTLANKYFANINDTVTEKPGVNKYVTDGRNFLLLSKNKYDLVSIQISSIWFAGAASLYNKEFYGLINKHLKPDGVLQQWVQIHHITNYDLLYIIGSIRSEFKYVWLYIVGRQGILVATNDQARFPSKTYTSQLGVIFADKSLPIKKDESVQELLQDQVLQPGDVDRMLESFIKQYGKAPISDNDNSILEYSTPKGNVLETEKSYQENLRWLESFHKH